VVPEVVVEVDEVVSPTPPPLTPRRLAFAAETPENRMGPRNIPSSGGRRRRRRRSSADVKAIEDLKDLVTELMDDLTERDAAEVTYIETIQRQTEEKECLHEEIEKLKKTKKKLQKKAKTYEEYFADSEKHEEVVRALVKKANEVSELYSRDNARLRYENDELRAAVGVQKKTVQSYKNTLDRVQRDKEYFEKKFAEEEKKNVAVKAGAERRRKRKRERMRETVAPLNVAAKRPRTGGFGHASPPRVRREPLEEDEMREYMM
jgi:DNA repair exonuclease SbcCD ATPase subunit